MGIYLNTSKTNNFIYFKYFIALDFSKGNLFNNILSNLLYFNLTQDAFQEKINE